ncbi:sarcosine oxidase subunit delta [Yoonia sp. SS1-5]|uniref:Sarcosine oxidase subunit delta n=1 Tax=Yoonia rhodophyticola TaxID=3137370 RepID=A0AAN0NL08_9RHOB
MQVFPCPFCGLRDEREFRYIAEAGKTRPDTARDVSAQDWAAYLFAQANPMGPGREIWVHIPCQEYFTMRRDTASMDVLDTAPLRKSDA